MPRKRIRHRRAEYVLTGDFAHGLERFKDASGLSWADIARLLGTSTLNLWRWRKRGVRPNAHHLLALQDLADSMGLGATCCQPQESADRARQYEEVITMHDRLLRRRDVERITGISRASIYRLMQEGDFPRPVKVGSTAVRWKESDIAAWIETRPVATNELGSNAAA